MTCLALYLISPLQSWGVGAKFNERSTLSFPSRSGVIGLIAAANGIDRTDDVWIEQTSKLKISVRAYKHEGKCADGKRLTDYHTVGGGYDDSKKGTWESNMAVAKAEGGVKTELTHRDYLQDAAFGVVISGLDDTEPLIHTIALNLDNPIWGVWLGRKCCIPTEPVLVGSFSDVGSAWEAISKRAERTKRLMSLPVTEVSPTDEVRDDSIMDVPISFSKRTFASRTVAFHDS